MIKSSFSDRVWHRVHNRADRGGPYWVDDQAQRQVFHQVWDQVEGLVDHQVNDQVWTHVELQIQADVEQLACYDQK